MRIDPQRLLRLGELIKQGSFKRAADKLAITQPAMSQSIAQMEAEIGLRLIERTPQGVVPTIYGKALTEHARAVEWQLKEAALKLRELAYGHVGKLAIGGMPGGAISIMALVIRRLRALAPDLDVFLIEENRSVFLIERISNRSLDFAICHHIDDIMLEGKIALPLFKDDRVICVRADHPAAADLSLPAASAYPFAHPGGDLEFHADIERIFSDAGLAVPDRPIVNSNSMGVAKELVLATDAYAIFSHLSVLQEVRLGLFRTGALSGPGSHYYNYLVMREDQIPGPWFGAFISTLLEVCGEVGAALHPDASRLTQRYVQRGGC